MGQQKVAEVIRAVLGDRLIWDPGVTKMCKDSHQVKRGGCESYKLKGFKLAGVDGKIHSGDQCYYSQNLQDIKELQSQIKAALCAAGYELDRVILYPDDVHKQWLLTVTIKTS